VERVVRNALATWQAAGGCRESQNPLLVFEKKAYVDVMESYVGTPPLYDSARETYVFAKKSNVLSRS
jgi:hypothetical protein